jgi:hypothetical protein
MSTEIRAFQPGPTVSQNLAVTAGAAAITLNNTGGTRQARIVTSGTTAVFLAFDTVATTTQGMIVLGNTTEVITLPQACATISAIATATGVTLYVEIGTGS